MVIAYKIQMLYKNSSRKIQNLTGVKMHEQRSKNVLNLYFYGILGNIKTNFKSGGCKLIVSVHSPT